MGFITGVLAVVYFITCIVLIVIVLMQEPKGGGLSSAFGGSGLDTAFGASIGRKMSSFTVWLAVFFLLMTIGLAILSKRGGGMSSDSIMQGIQKESTSEEAGEQPEKGPEKKVVPPDGQENTKKPEPPQAPAAKEPPAGENQETKPTPEKQPGSDEEKPEAPGKDS